MMDMLRVMSLNCHGFNLSTAQYLRRHADSIDVILLQETWLCDANCCRVSDAFDDFIVFHNSAMEGKFATGINVGRPYGGTAILVHKRLGSFTHRIVTDNPRITVVKCCIKNNCDIIIGSVYMPYNDNSLHYDTEFEFVIGELQGIVDKFYDCKFIIGGDFNISKLSCNNTCKLLSRFCNVNNISWLDHATDVVDYTYYNDTLGTYSLLDHFLCSAELSGLDSSISSHILNDGDNTSDHLAIRCEFPTGSKLPNAKIGTCSVSKLLWDKADVQSYQSTLRETLSYINLPYDALLCTKSACTDHSTQLEHYYTEIVNCLVACGEQCIPHVKVGIHKYWWCPELDDLKQQCIDMTALWSSLGRPRSGNINAERLRSKYRYKQAIKTAMQENDRAFNDDLYDYLCQKDETSFWKAWRKRFCANSLKPTNVLNGKVGTDNVLSEFTTHFASTALPHTAGANDALASDVQKLLSEKEKINNAVPQVTVCDVEKCIDKLKRNKAAYLDKVTGEHLMYGGSHTVVHLTLLFNSMLRHCFVPSDFCQGMVLPLLKCKHGDTTDINMYRGITISPVISKVFELILLQVYESLFTSQPLQYGF